MLIAPVRVFLPSPRNTANIVAHVALDVIAGRDAQAQFDVIYAAKTALDAPDARAAFAAQGVSSAQAAYDGRRALVNTKPRT